MLIREDSIGQDRPITVLKLLPPVHFFLFGQYKDLKPTFSVHISVIFHGSAQVCNKYFLIRVIYLFSSYLPSFIYVISPVLPFR